MPTILLVDDSAEILRLTADYLVHAGFKVVAAGTAEGALRLVRLERPDLLILDLGLPDGDGLDVARAIRRTSDLPIIMLTARTEETDTLIGLELGADDYITKPFSPRELVARIRAVLRRAETARAPTAVVEAGDLALDLDRMLVTVVAGAST